MATGSDFAALDRRAAENFGRAGVRRIVYLGGLVDDTGTVSAHLRSRAETGDMLRAGGVPVIEFRASVVIGAGSLSFQMIQALRRRSLDGPWLAGVRGDAARRWRIVDPSDRHI